jgi:DNA-binding NarL/FixJ family response regulator
MEKKHINILLVDDHELILEGMAQLVESIAGFRVVGKAENGKIALQLVEALKPDMVLMDVDMPVMNGLEATKRIKAQYPDTQVLILTMHNEDALVKRMKEIGADGFILKNADRDSFVEALSSVAGGQKDFAEIAKKTSTASGNVDEWTNATGEDTKRLMMLSERETEILRHIAMGRSNKEIGDVLFISHRTVDTHRTSIMKKMEVHNVAGLVRIALRNGMISG